MTRPPAAEAVRLLLRGPQDDLALGFVNTKFWRGTASPTETLRSPAEFWAWCEGTRLWDAEALRRMGAWRQARPAADTALFADVIALREALFRSFSAAIEGSAPAPADLGALNAALAAAPARALLRGAAGGLLWQLPAGAEPDPVLALAPVLWSAGDLLAGPRLGRVRQCANPQCRWMFLDESKGGNRRWCSMAACGNRAKAHRHYAKRRGTA